MISEHDQETLQNFDKIQDSLNTLKVLDLVFVSE